MTDNPPTASPLDLDQQTADAILTCIDRLESELDEHVGWDQPPGLFVIHTLVDTDQEFCGVALAQIAVPLRQWQRAGDPVTLLDALADAMAGDPMLALSVTTATPEGFTGYEQRPVGMAFACEAWERDPDADRGLSTADHPEARLDEMRIIVAVDRDGRLYQVIRGRHSGKRTATCKTLEEERQRAADLGETGTPRVPDCLRRMVLAAIRGPGE